MTEFLRRQTAYCLGDHTPLKTFFSLLLSPDKRSSFSEQIPTKGELHITAQNGSNCSITVQEGTGELKITSPAVPAGFVIKSASREFQWSESNDCAYVFLLTGWTGMLDGNLEMLLKQLPQKIIQKPFVQYAVLQMPNDKKNAATDLLNAETARENAKQQIRDVLKKNAIEQVVELIEIPKDGISDPFFLFAGGNRSVCFGLAAYKAEIQTKISSFESAFSEEHGDYKLRLGGMADELTSPEMIENCFSWNTLKGNESIQHRAAVYYLNRIEWKDFLEAVLDLYADLINDLAFWDIEKDKNNLRDIIMQKAKAHLIGKERPVYVPPNVCSKASFDIFMVEHRTLRDQFQEKTKNIVHQIVPETVTEFLKRVQTIFIDNRGKK